MRDGVPHDDVLLSPPMPTAEPGVTRINVNRLRKLFLLHVPKTAGSSLNHLFSELYGESHVLQHLESDPNWIDSLSGPDIRYASGHLPAPVLFKSLDRSVWNLVSLLRNPVDHLISHLKWVKHLAAPEIREFLSNHPEPIRELAHRLWAISLNDIDRLGRLIEELEIARQLFDNGQLRYFIPYKAALIDHDDAIQAITALWSFDHVGLTEKLPQFCVAISELTGQSIDVSRIAVRNATKTTETVNLGDSVVLDFYLMAVRWDAALHVAAKNRLNANSPRGLGAVS